MIGHGKYIVTNTESDGGTIIFTLRGLSSKALAGTYVRVKCFRGDAWFHVVFWLLGANCIFYSFFYKEELLESAVSKANSSASGMEKLAKIYGKTGSKLTLYRKSINDAAVDIAKDQPELVLDKGLYSYCMLSC